MPEGPHDVVSWYCHPCGKTHTHTVADRDAHRDEIMAAWAKEIDEKATRGY